MLTEQYFFLDIIHHCSLGCVSETTLQMKITMMDNVQKNVSLLVIFIACKYVC
jgi:hypothetical protein